MALLYGGVLLYCFSYVLNNHYQVNVPIKTVEVTYTIYQGLSKRQLCKEYFGRKVNNMSGVKFAPKFCAKYSLSLPQSNNLA